MTYTDAIAALITEKALHDEKWGHAHGLRFTNARQFNTPLDDSVDGGGLVLVSQISGPGRWAFLLAPAVAEVVFEVGADGARRVVTDADPLILDNAAAIVGLAEWLVATARHTTAPRLVGTTDAVIEELQHKLLAGAGLVPFRNGGVGAAEYRIVWPGGTSVPVGAGE